MSSIRYSFRSLYLCLVQIDDVHPHRLGFSASVERAALGLAIEESNQSARMRKHIIISSGKDFALDILAVFPLYGHFYCLFCSILHRQVAK